MARRRSKRIAKIPVPEYPCPMNLVSVFIPEDLEPHLNLLVHRINGNMWTIGKNSHLDATKEACSLVIWAALRNGLITDAMILDELRRIEDAI